jgi:phosphoketolase
MATLLQSERVDGPNDQRVQVLFYDDESIRFRVYAYPLVIEEAFLTGNRQGHSILKVAPKAQ